MVSCELDASGTMDHGPQGWRIEGWDNTDFSKHNVDFKSILSGGPGRDGIPPIYEPEFTSTEEASGWLSDSEPVIVFERGKKSRAYPLRILMWHEIVNDVLDKRSYIVTFCPLCNAAVVYDTNFGGRNHRFGVSGKLRNSDMVMWDHTTESWWQQLTGEAIVGSSTGRKLKPLPSQMISFGTYKKLRPTGEVLSQETGHRRNYGENPYVRYDSGAPFFPVPGNKSGIRTMDRVMGLESQGKMFALAVSSMRGKRYAILKAGETDLVAFNLSSANSALDKKSIEASKKIPHITLFKNTESKVLQRLVWRNGALIDKDAGTVWNALGEGFLEGKKLYQLEPVGSGIFFAFAWFGFYPESDLLEIPKKEP
jgi:hypothetical protein